MNSSEFMNNLPFWTRGPSFLSDDQADWPDKELGCLSDESRLLTMNVVSNTNDCLLPVDKYSNLNKLLRVTAIVYRFIDRLRRKVKSRLDYYNNAKKYWIKCEQEKHFQKEIQFLRSPGVKNPPPLVNNLNLFLDESGLLRSKGRLEHTDNLDYGAKNPIMLPRNSFFTTLMIEDVHFRCKHLGIGTTLTKLRLMGYWVTKGRMTVKSVLAKCYTCKKLNAYAFRYPVTNDYIKNKVNFVSVYQHTGVDCTGHTFVKFGGKMQKMYVLLFTCINVRAIHLELLPDLTCQSFLLAFIRFCNRYRTPEVVYSDNANYFLQAMGIIAESSSDNMFSDYLIKNNIRHLRIPLYSAWVGAAWERLIKTLKLSLSKTLGRKHVPYFELLTLLSDIQDAINSRPLTYVESDPNFKVITPNDFLKFDSKNTLVLDNVAGGELEVADSKQLVQSLENRASQLERLKEEWLTEYMLSLREAARDRYQDGWKNKIEEGEIVLISHPSKPRTYWQLGKVTELLPGLDGVVRTVKVLRPDRKEGVYAIKHLYPLELKVNPVNVGIPSTPAKPELADNLLRRSSRLAAKSNKI